jgi:2-phosphoglycolate phosphatase
MNQAFDLKCVLFDLDGTLVDTAPDLIAAMNQALLHHGFPQVAEARVRPLISFGAAVMLQQSVADSEQQAAILATMLTHYQQHILQAGGLFEGIADTLAWIENRGLKWGVVTNKAQRFTVPLMQALQLTERAACIISGDTTAHCKPHPEPMWAACEQAGVHAEQCVYIGDAQHDITAGKNARMKTLAAVYGYLTAEAHPEHWGAEALVQSPAQIQSWLESQL